MRRRLLLAKAMSHQPPVLVLDEPTAQLLAKDRKIVSITLADPQTAIADVL